MTEKHTRNLFKRRPTGRVFGWLTTAAVALAAATLAAQAPQYPVPSGGFNAPTQQLQLPALPTPVAITPNGQVVEDVIARINDAIITRSEYERSEQQLLQDGQQQNVPAAELEDRLHNLLRDMIDQQLLLAQGKQDGTTCDSEVIRRLDDIRKQNHLDSMEALEKAAAQQGVSFEDFKQGIRNQCITQQVVRDDVGRKLEMTHTQEQAYYDAHTKDFELPEQVHLSEILVPTPDNATDAQVAEAQTKADALEAKLKGGAVFADVAKASSGGPTASAGGDLGDFKRGTLGDVLEKATFSLPAGAFTAPIRTRQGFVILRVDSHQAAGVPSLDQVEPQVQEALYMDELQPALRTYLTKQRQNSYVDIKAGFVDSGSASNRTNKPQFTAYAPLPIKHRTLARQKAEQERAAKAATELAAARERVAEKQAAKAAANAQRSGTKNASRPVKPQKIRREKIRYGQAPRNALPAATTATTETSVGVPIAGQAAGVAMAPTESTTSITTGVGTENETDPLAAQQEAPTHKTRFASRQQETVAKVDEAKFNKAEVKANDRPTPATTQEAATEKTQAAPLGLNGDTTKKPKKPKREKGAAKERLEQKPAPAPAAPVAPTVNPALGIGANGTGTSAPPPAASNHTTLPPVNTGAPGVGSPAGQPIPATTSAEPGQPATTPTPH
jgi:peptidyl-prolyl cis-trans isomerase SurA